MRLRWLLTGLVGLLLLTAGCDSTPGVREEAAPPAFVSGSFSFAPHEVPLQVPDTLPNVGVTVPLRMEVRVRNPARMDSVKYVVRSPLRGLTLSEIEGIEGAKGVLHPTGETGYEVDTTLTLLSSLPGVYTVVVYGVGAEGRLSRQELSGTLRLIVNGGGPPVVENLASPDTVQVPASGTEPVLIRATVTDPQGFLNIGTVELKAPDGARYPMRDDGGQVTGSGDNEAGDGVFTARYLVEPGQPAGTYTFTVRATDRSGQESAPASFDITFVQ